MSELSNDRAGQTPRWVIPAILVGVVSLVGFGVLGVALTMLASKDSPQDGKADQAGGGKAGEVVDGALRVDVVKMAQDYYANEAAADAKYLGKLVEADASVKPIRKGSGGIYMMEGGIGHALFVFPASETDSLAGLSGGGVRIRGRCRGVKGTVIIGDCRIVQKLVWKSEPNGNDWAAGRWVPAK
jgi:hypothetical protein